MAPWVICTLPEHFAVRSMARAVAVAMSLVSIFSVLAFVPPEPQALRGLRMRPARAAAPASKLRKLRELPSPALGLLFSCAFCALLLGAAQAGASSLKPPGQVDFVSDPPIPRAVLQEKQMTKVKLAAAPSILVATLCKAPSASSSLSMSLLVRRDIALSGIGIKKFNKHQKIKQASKNK